MKDKLLESIINQSNADDLTTEAIEHIENSNFTEAVETIKAALMCSSSIEQRICLQMLLQIALAEDEEMAQRILTIAYDYE